MLDGDKPGKKAAIIIKKKMMLSELNFKTVYLIDKCEPEKLDFDELEN